MRASLPVSEAVAVPDTARRWVEEGREWLREKQSRGKWTGRNGYEALRFLRRCGEWVEVPPFHVEERHVWAIVSRVGPSPKTKRTYLAILGGFLAWRGNRIVQESGIRSTFPNQARYTPVVPAEDRDRVLTRAVGIERVVTALLGVGRRRVEIVRARVEDFRTRSDPPEYDVRGKGGAGRVTHTAPLVPSLERELAWYLPLRARWSEDSTSDAGTLICRKDARRLVGVSSAYVDRILDAAEDRAGVRRWPGHAFRRATATMLRERGADWEDVSEALTHSSPVTTRLYVDPLVRRRRLSTVLCLIEPSGQEAKP